MRQIKGKVSNANVRIWRGKYYPANPPLMGQSIICIELTNSAAEIVSWKYLSTLLYIRVAKDISIGFS